MMLLNVHGDMFAVHVSNLPRGAGELFGAPSNVMSNVKHAAVTHVVVDETTWTPLRLYQKPIETTKSQG